MLERSLLIIVVLCSTSLDTVGYVYVPPSCAAQQPCKVSSWRHMEMLLTRLAFAAPRLFPRMLAIGLDGANEIHCAERLHQMQVLQPLRFLTMLRLNRG